MIFILQIRVTIFVLSTTEIKYHHYNTTTIMACNSQMKTVKDINQALEDLDNFQKEVDQYRKDLIALKKWRKKQEKKDTRFDCNVAGCRKSYTTKKGLKRHFRFRHLGVREKRKVHQCKKCAKTYRRKNDLEKHNKRVCS